MDRANDTADGKHCTRRRARRKSFKKRTTKKKNSIQGLFLHPMNTTELGMNTTTTTTKRVRAQYEVAAQESNFAPIHVH